MFMRTCRTVYCKRCKHIFDLGYDEKEECPECYYCHLDIYETNKSKTILKYVLYYILIFAVVILIGRQLRFI